MSSEILQLPPWSRTNNRGCAKSHARGKNCGVSSSIFFSIRWGKSCPFMSLRWVYHQFVTSNVVALHRTKTILNTLRSCATPMFHLKLRCFWCLELCSGWVWKSTQTRIENRFNHTQVFKQHKVITWTNDTLELFNHKSKKMQNYLPKKFVMNDSKASKSPRFQLKGLLVVFVSWTKFRVWS